MVSPLLYQQALRAARGRRLPLFDNGRGRGMRPCRLRECVISAGNTRASSGVRQPGKPLGRRPSPGRCRAAARAGTAAAEARADPFARPTS